MRANWNQYFMEIAYDVAARSTCDRLHVGAVITNDQKRILATGYNGSMAGMPHCEDEGCRIESGHCVNTIHAEMNAIAQAAKSSISVDGGYIYCTHAPCWNCFKMLVNAGIRTVYFAEIYRGLDPKIIDSSVKLHLKVRRLPPYGKINERKP